MLNNHLHVPTFKMETAESIRESIQKGDCVTSIDLRRLFSCSNSSTISKVSEISKKKKCFPFSGTLFWCHNSSPRVYSHCERGKTLSSSREPQNPSISGRLASSLTNKGTMSQRFRKFSKLVQELGWLINFQKSELVPTQNWIFWAITSIFRGV